MCLSAKINVAYVLDYGCTQKKIPKVVVRVVNYILNKKGLQFMIMIITIYEPQCKVSVQHASTKSST